MAEKEIKEAEEDIAKAKENKEVNKQQLLPLEERIKRLRNNEGKF
jgi:hypothetical protein